MSDGRRELETYRAKRDFSATPEPAPTKVDDGGDRPRFVVQEHHARSLHWDFRLERDGVLVSWAVPKGIPPDPRVNHLAVPTEDHPLPYAEFEGEIPKGNYGAGQVHLWDRGTYDCEKWEPGEVMVVLHGQRVRGRYVLFRTGDRQWMIHRMDPPEDPDRQPMPEALEPMWATPGELPAGAAAYGLEILWRGKRVLAGSEGGRATFRDPAGIDVTATYPQLRGLGPALGAREVVLDGVVAALDGKGTPADRPPEDGRPGAHQQDVGRAAGGAGAPAGTAMRPRPKSHRQSPIAYMVFDVLYLDGRVTLTLTYEKRRDLLATLGLAGPGWQAPAHHVGDGESLLGLARQRGLAGVVAKRLDSPYEPGARSPAWIEVRA